MKQTRSSVALRVPEFVCYSGRMTKTTNHLRVANSGIVHNTEAQNVTTGGQVVQAPSCTKRKMHGYVIPAQVSAVDCPKCLALN